MKEGMVVHVGHWMQFLNSKIEAVSDEGDWRKLTRGDGRVHTAPFERAVRN
jgi:hypothetical protein